MMKDLSLDAARSLDREDPLRLFRSEFLFPKTAHGSEPLYFVGHSLGLMPKKSKEYVDAELDSWGKLAVEGHFTGAHPWKDYHENVTASLARLVGAKPQEVVAMNSLTVNLHLLLVSFYRPHKDRFKILIEGNTFPSDKYAVDSQARFHGYDPKEAVVELKSQSMTISESELEEQIRAHGKETALILLGNCNYLSGQKFDFAKITKLGHELGAHVGFNLAHGAGNLLMNLHADQVDFATWCSYKYLNSGPGGIAGIFIHENHLQGKSLPRFEGWWGHNKESRFKMGPQFDPIPTAEAWQLSNPPIWQLASLRASLEIFDRAGIASLRKKGDQITLYMEKMLEERLRGKVEFITPKETEYRGSMICLRLLKPSAAIASELHKRGCFIDYREPGIVRMTPVPLYNSYEDVYRFVEIFSQVVGSFA